MVTIEKPTAYDIWIHYVMLLCYNTANTVNNVFLKQIDLLCKGQTYPK